MSKSARRKILRYCAIWLMLVALFVVQLWSLTTTLALDLASDRHSIIAAADAMITLIGVMLAWIAWDLRPGARRNVESRPSFVKTQIVGPRPLAAGAAVPHKQQAPLRAASTSSARRAVIIDRAKDIPDATASLQDLAHKAQHDSLTGLPNRSLALDRLQQMIARAERHQQSFAVMFIDLNGFKPLNDTYGHDFGDKVLRKTAARLKRSMRGLDTVARLGGDEFLVIMDQVDEAGAMSAAETLSTIVSQPVTAKQGPVCVGMSTGIAIYPKHGAAARQLLRVADAAMYRSKRGGGQPVVAETMADTPCPMSRTGRFNDTTSINPRLLDTWEGTLRGVRELSENQGVPSKS